MKPMLLLIDLQQDFLISPMLEPSAGQIVERAALMLQACRHQSIPIAHIWIAVHRENDRRMPHWKRLGTWQCVEGTIGYATPAPLAPKPEEFIIHKTFFSAFSSGELDGILNTLGIDTLLIGGVHLHACIRQTVLDAYQRGLQVWVAEDATGSNDPVHAAISRRYLQSRAAQFVSVTQIVDRINSNLQEQSQPQTSLPVSIIAHRLEHLSQLKMLIHASPRKPHTRQWIPLAQEEQVNEAAIAARQAGWSWITVQARSRVMVLERLAKLLEGEIHSLARQMVEDIGKPMVEARGEVLRTVALLRAVASRATEPLSHPTGSGAVFRYRAIGVIAAITPWNNPLYIPLGKIAPALLYGNSVVWKPAPAGSAIAVKIMEYLEAVDCPPGLVNLVCGDRTTAEILMSHPEIDAVTLTGSSLAGYCAQEICARRRIPLQAELGGNNAAIVLGDADLPDAARQIALGAFGMAGQRCTANRRVIVEQNCYDEFLALLVPAVANLSWGDPMETQTQIGPLISATQRERVGAIVDRAAKVAEAIIVPHATSPNYAALMDDRSNYYPPTIVCCNDPQQEIVQEETFCPVLVVQQATHWDEAIALCNGVRQGLVAALFSGSQDMQHKFLTQAEAGILKLNRATADADVDLPFGGWKASGIGPAEHGESDKSFYTRVQTIYG